MLEGSDRMVQVLSLTGGGVRGLFSASVLAEIDPKPERFRQMTDVFAGTSVGALIALGLAKGYGAKELADLIEDKAEAIFPRRWRGARKGIAWMAANAFNAIHDPKRLREVTEEILEGKRLGDLERRVLIPTVDLTAGRARTFIGGVDGPDAERSAADVAVASAAAPIYYPVQQVGADLFADGGLIANAPDAIAALDTLRNQGVSQGRVRMLAVGTTRKAYALASAPRCRRWGVARWSRIIGDCASAGQVEQSRAVARTLLGSDRYLSIDPVRTPAQEVEIGLDTVTPAAKATLRAMAGQAIGDALVERGDFLSLWRVHEAIGTR